MAMAMRMRKRSRQHRHSDNNNTNNKRSGQPPYRSSRLSLSVLALGLLTTKLSSTSAFLIPTTTTSRSVHTFTSSSLTSRTRRFAGTNKNNEDEKSNLEEDIVKKLSISKDRAISALSQLNKKEGTPSKSSDNNSKKQDDKQKPGQQQQQGSSKRFKDVKKRGNSRDRKLLPTQQPVSSSTRRSSPDGEDSATTTRDTDGSTSETKRRNNNRRRKSKSSTSKASLLPPPLSNLSDDDLTSGLSSWEEFLGQTNAPIQDERKVNKNDAQLPTISDLFPPNLATTAADETTKPGGAAGGGTGKDDPATPAQNKNMKGMDGVLPVSELFYRSSQSLTEETLSGNADDEELPFSAEQTDSLLTTDGNVQVRRNQANNKRRRSRKMVRRGMEMLVGGVPINVDPPQRSVELHYQFDATDWARAISLNSRDFGPLLHQTAKDVTALERGLYCESFVHNAIKWDVCPKDLRDIVKNHHDKQRPTSYSSLLEEVNAVTSRTDDDDGDDDEWGRDLTTGDKSSSSSSSDAEDAVAQAFLEHSDMPFEFQFSIDGVSKQELETVTDPASLENVILKAIVLVAKDKLLAPDFVLVANKLMLSEGSDESTTDVSLEFHFEAEGEEEDLMPFAQSIKPTLRKALSDGTFAEAVAEVATEESGWFEEVLDQLSDEWLFIPNEANNDDDNNERDKPMESKMPSNKRDDDDAAAAGPFGVEARDTDDLFLGGGNGGVFFDYSASNIENAPFQGSLGPLLLDAAVERAKQRYPRVIAIGDVHGCIDELQDLLRLCDYQPGDLVIFLGDLVCKGPDSISVVQMAREIGAMGIRGNHDFEVVRWYQAIQSGVDPPVVGSEHFHIASCLNKADMKWLYSLPWYISSKDLGALFVHAGLVAGIRLAKQNPRLMMNMRSILPDGTVTSKFFSNWPWARLWDGPQTVLFGHDADRGLQQYEHAIGLDTGCVYGGRLTACILPEKRLVSVPARREYFKYRRRHYD